MKCVECKFYKDYRDIGSGYIVARCEHPLLGDKYKDIKRNDFCAAYEASKPDVEADTKKCCNSPMIVCEESTWRCTNCNTYYIAPLN